MNTLVAKKVRIETTIHNSVLIYDYAWLKGKRNPKVLQYLEEENAYTETMQEYQADIII